MVWYNYICILFIHLPWCHVYKIKLTRTFRSRTKTNVFVIDIGYRFIFRSIYNNYT